MSHTYGHSATESVVASLADTPRATGLDLTQLEEIAAYFREVRKKYVKFEGALRGVDARILVAQVPGGMLTNLESQLKEQGASDRLDAVLAEIPRVRQDLGHIPLVTPTSQIVGTQAVLNVLAGERYKSIAAETAGILKGTYGATPAPVDEALRARVLKPGEAPVVCRPADLLEPELERLSTELAGISRDKGIRLAEARDALYLAQPQFRPAKNPPQNPSGFIVDTLRAVFHGLFNSADFETGMIDVVNRGGDADTTGAIYGMIAGALYGLEGIPRRWRDALDPGAYRACEQQALALMRLGR